MFSNLKRLHHFDIKTIAFERCKRLKSAGVSRLTIDLSSLAGDEIIAALPVIESAARLCSSPPRLAGAKGPVLHALESHLRRIAPRAPPARKATVALRVGFSSVDNASPTWSDNGSDIEIELQNGEEPRTPQNAYVGWLRAGLAVGLEPREEAPRLRLARDELRAARNWLHKRVGHTTGPLVAVVRRSTDVPFVSLLGEARRALEDELGLKALEIDRAPENEPRVSRPSLSPGFLLGCALCVGDDPDWTAMAAALNVPTIRLNPVNHPAAPRQRYGLELLHWGLPGRDFQMVCRRFRFNHDLNLRNLIAVGERMAAIRWPRDRLFRILP